MKFKKCTHPPYVVRITFDIGFDQTAEYELCVNCKQMPVFRDFIVSEEILSEKNNTAEVKFSDRTSTDSSGLEMIT